MGERPIPGGPPPPSAGGGEALTLAVRALAVVSVAWLPIVLLTAIDRAVTGVWDPILLRSEVHLRLLLALPLFLCGQASLEHRVRDVGAYLVRGSFLSSSSASAWKRRLTRLRGIRDCRWPELVLVAMIVALSMGAYLGAVPGAILRWLAPSLEAAGPDWHGSTAAWWWYVLVAQPMFLFVLGRWLFHWALWGAALWALPRHGPYVRATHADGAAGLGFLAAPLFSYRFLIVGVAASLTAVWLDEMTRGEVRAMSALATDFFGFVCFDIALGFAPYAALTPLLVRTKQRYIDRYGPAHADIGASLAVLGAMRTMIPNRDELRAQTFVATLPLVALVFVHVVPVVEIVERILES